ncbi:DUF6444 domain-containing protein [Saccharopolyspora sp. ASAGF58]|uniref:DUF6444 domain-containing protein n=1 Tax=Saccharopolyspora sp. ASAGF58 TaxID=2719023 RepID=UPI003530219E
MSAEVAALRAENAELKRRLGMDSTNSSTPPSQDSLAAKGKRRAQRSQRVRSKDRKPGGQPGHRGSGLQPAVKPDRSETAPEPAQCWLWHGSGRGAGCGDVLDAGLGYPADPAAAGTTGCRNGSAAVAGRPRPRRLLSGRPGRSATGRTSTPRRSCCPRPGMCRWSAPRR